MATFCINLNIHYSAPQKIWNKLEKLYTEMPHWKGFVNGCPQWYGEDGRLIEGSVEPGGLQLCRRKSGMNGYNFSKKRQLLHWGIVSVNPKTDMTLNIGNNANSFQGEVKS